MLRDTTDEMFGILAKFSNKSWMILTVSAAPRGVQKGD